MYIGTNRIKIRSYVSTSIIFNICCNFVFIKNYLSTIYHIPEIIEKPVCFDQTMKSIFYLLILFSFIKYLANLNYFRNLFFKYIYYLS